MRRINVFFQYFFIPFSKKIIAIIFLFLAIFFLVKPSYLHNISDKISQIFVEKFNFNKIDYDNIEISGINKIQRDEIIKIIAEIDQNFVNKNSESKIEKYIFQIKNNLPWVNKISIHRSLPNKLKIEIIEYIPFAILQNNEEKFIIDKDGNKIKIDNPETFENLIILSGNDANLNAKSLFNIFVINPEISAKIYSATFVGNRRWDIRFENGLLVKLPSHQLTTAWQHLIKIYNSDMVKNLKTIDLRVEKKIYLEYSNQSVKEIRNVNL